MGSTRFFLADLPARTKEQDLRSLFQDYGHVERVELKKKEQVAESDQTAKVIAFVTVQTEDAQYCISELNWQKLHGAKLRVTLAKESFLDRLKRERDEAQQSEQSSSTPHEFNQNSSRLLADNTQNKRRVFGEHEEIGDDEVAPELLMTKKHAAHSLHNGKIVIQQEHDVKPLHIIEQHKKPAKQLLDAKAAIADQKRKESLNKKKQQHQQNKFTIQSALASTEGSQAKRIKFSDAEEEEDVDATEQKHRKNEQEKHTKMDLFDDDDEDDEEQDIVLPQYSGKKGERLVEMQSKQSIDSRFRITANFVGDEEEEEDEEAENDKHHNKQHVNGQESERNWQMGILEQVIGRKIDTATAPGAKASKNKKMLRFDPAKEEHQNLVRQKPIKDGKVAKETHLASRDTNEDVATPAPVSQSAFYVVTDTLRESLKTRGEGFSLLDMFGSSHDELAAERQGQLEQLGKEKILVNKTNKLGLGTVNPFSYDSSDSEDEQRQEQEQEQQQTTTAKENEVSAKKSDKKQKQTKIFVETFFMPKNDVRLKEGAKFFKSNKPELETETYDAVKKRLKFMITKKIAKTNKKLLPGKSFKKNKNKKG